METIQIAGSSLVKEVIVAGKGAKPPPGANVSAHYSGKLTNGVDFDSSRKRGRPFQLCVFSLLPPAFGLSTLSHTPQAPFPVYIAQLAKGV